MRIRDTELGIDTRLTDPAVWNDPYPFYTRLRETAPFVRCRELFRGDAWLVSRYEDVVTVLKDADCFRNDVRSTSEGPPPFDRAYVPKIMKAFARSMVFVDGLDHRRLRDLAMKAFTPVRVNELQTRIGQIATGLLDEVADQRRFNLMTAFARPLPLRIISEMLGVSKSERRTFHRAIHRAMGLDSEGHLVGRTWSAYSLHRLFKRLLDQKRADPTDDLTSALIEAEDQGDRLTPEELMGTVFLLLFAGHETTVNLIGNGTLALLEHPEQLERLRADRTFLSSAVEEMLRYYSPAHVTQTRHVVKSCVVGGRELRRGEKIVPLVGAANRDEAAFPQAATFDVGRDPNKHVAFGAGPHFCIGAHLSRVEGRIAFAALLDHFPRLELAVNRDQLRWTTGNGGLRGLAALPIAAS